MDETLFLTINLIDRFLERCTVTRKKLQLVGVTAMLLACKYEEVSVPLVEDFVLISDNTYTRIEILDMVFFFSSWHGFSLFHQWHFFYLLYYSLLPFHQWRDIFLKLFLMLLVGEINGEHFTIQLVFTNPLYVHEEFLKAALSDKKVNYY